MRLRPRGQRARLPTPTLDILVSGRTSTCPTSAGRHQQRGEHPAASGVGCALGEADEGLRNLAQRSVGRLPADDRARRGVLGHPSCSGSTWTLWPSLTTRCWRPLRVGVLYAPERPAHARRFLYGRDMIGAGWWRRTGGVQRPALEVLRRPSPHPRRDRLRPRNAATARPGRCGRVHALV